MKFNFLFLLSVVLLFLGLLWSFLPHAAHSKIAAHDESEFKHIWDIFIGAGVAVVGIVLLIWDEGRREN